MQGVTASETQILHCEEMVEAIYSDQIVQDYESNPLIEALPPIFTEDDVIEHLSVIPSYDEKERTLNANYRFHCVQTKIVSIFSAF
ncbi:MAG: hypothetical protein ACQEW2_22250 [Bacillota bacterium]|uniref:hypothetical protein n=1 Tax=Cytobacillus firmus TaxID=1399 RepID=UPI00077CC141|nr:hypothetical protein [Cytobacillus firmus]MEC1894089.1 hypothetical protein [Cytobacillus firmus]MED4451289.1 hypothetical protein [Cytobacillus firmus]MED4768967.1 hypothetical protein [Cytobacillus firmus]SUU99443.1 ATPase AAA [Cytobacillus firmus]